SEAARTHPRSREARHDPRLHGTRRCCRSSFSSFGSFGYSSGDIPTILKCALPLWSSAARARRRHARVGSRRADHLVADPHRGAVHARDRILQKWPVVIVHPVAKEAVRHTQDLACLGALVAVQPGLVDGSTGGLGLLSTGPEHVANAALSAAHLT